MAGDTWRTWADVPTMLREPPPPSARWLIDSMVPGDGFTLILAPSKMGKSTLAIQIASSLDHAGAPGTSECLGHPVNAPTRTLYIQSDCPLGDWHGHLSRLAPTGRFAHMWTERHWLGTPQERQVEEFVQRTKPGLVVVDALESVNGPRFDLNTWAGMTGTLDRLRHVVGSPFVLLHHYSKPRGDGTPRPSWVSASGHHSLHSQASTILTFNEDQWGRVSLVVEGRLIVPQPATKLTRHPTTGGWVAGCP